MSVLGSVLLLVLVGSSASITSDQEISAASGDDVTLPCGDPSIHEIFLLEWSKPDLQGEETVFLYRNDGVILHQDESFRNRVFLNNSQMTGGDLSVVLKNLKVRDSGAYECRFLQRGDSQRSWKRISTINLQVSPPDLRIKAGSGEDIILPCGDASINQDSGLEWTRSDLQEGQYVFLYRSGGVNPAGQHESFRNRVFLNNSQMTGGDLSVVLKSLKIRDSGTYECRVLQRNDPTRGWKLIYSIHLQVSPPGQEGGTKDGDSHGLLGLISILVLLVVVVVFWSYKKRRKSKFQNNLEPEAVVIMCREVSNMSRS